MRGEQDQMQEASALAKGLDELEQGRVRPGDEVLEELRAKHFG